MTKNHVTTLHVPTSVTFISPLDGKSKVNRLTAAQFSQKILVSKNSAITRKFALPVSSSDGHFSL